MDPTTEKRQALKRAKEIISEGKDDELRYVALELRRCIEAVVYEKLVKYEDRFSPKVARTWQPAHALKALLVLEPNANKTSTTRFAKQIAQGVPSPDSTHTYTDRRFDHEWLSTTYNKIGSFLHASWPFEKKASPYNTTETKREFLQQVINEIELHVSECFTDTIAETVTFKCSECNTVIQANAAGIKITEEITCLNPNCNCHYFVTTQENEVIYQLDCNILTCEKCMEETRIPTQKIKKGFKLRCKKCTQQYEIVNQIWEIEEIEKKG